MRNKLKTYFKLFRINNYIKNLFVFAPLFFNFQFDNATIVESCFVFLLFCLMASGIYTFNDVFDLQSDKKHPIKKTRPMASGKISVKEGVFLGVLLITSSLLGAYLLNLKVFYVFILYVFINTLYNLYLKEVPILDVLIISLGFIIRIMAGSSATSIPPSYWILVITFLLSMFLGFSKRRSDVVLASKIGNGSRNISIFSLQIINQILIAFAIIICGVYFMYTMSDDVVTRIGSKLVYITNVFVILGILRYTQIIKKSKHYSDPTTVVVNDWKLQVIILMWALTFIFLKYI